MSYNFQIIAANSKAGRCIIGNREVSFDQAPPDATRAPLFHAAVARYLADGSVSGTVTVAAS